MSSGPGGPGDPGGLGGPGGPGGPAGPGGPGEPSEEELQAAYEAEVKRLRVEHLLLEHVVGMVNLGMRRTGLAPGTEDERDAEQVRLAVESVRALMPLLEQTAPQQVAQIRSALSQLQLAFVRIGGQPGGAPGEAAPGGRPAPEAESDPTSSSEPGGPPPSRPEPPAPEGPGPAQRSGRLWIPGQ